MLPSFLLAFNVVGLDAYEQAAAFLQLSRGTVISLALAGALGGALIRKHWVFTDESLQNFLRKEIEQQTESRKNTLAVANAIEQAKEAARLGLATRRRGRKARPIPPLY